jgi:hypothetical protein
MAKLLTFAMYPQADIDDTKGINNLVLILVLILGTVPKMIDTKTKIEFLAELSLLLFDIRLDVDQVGTLTFTGLVLGLMSIGLF